MKLSLYALIIGFFIDLLIGDPHCLWHPVVFIGNMISFFEKIFRKIFPKTKLGENIAGGFVFLIVSLISLLLPILILYICQKISIWLRLVVESLMCWQILATKSLKDESMKVYYRLIDNDIEGARKAVSMIVGRDTKNLDDKAITRAAVETVAENTSDGIIAPMIFMVIGGASAGFFYKAVNTMDSMLGYVEKPYKNIGLIPAKFDDLVNFLPSRISALIMLLSGLLLKLDFKNGYKIFKRDRYNHASPNSAQTESVCAGLLRVRLAGDAIYHGVLHKKKYIGDALREIEYSDIKRSCKLLYVTSFISLIIFSMIKILFIFFMF